LALSDLLARIVRLDSDGATDADLHEAAGTLQVLVTKMPYALIEIKPALGTIFADYLRTYSHWAIADLDILVGRMHRLLTPDVLRHDIYSASFGDSYRFYLRGQLTVHRNDPHVNTLWKRCHHLSRLRERLQAFADVGHEKWALQSAEGCYSKAVVDSNATVLVSPAQLSDAYEAPTTQRETVRVGDAFVSCYHAPLNVSALAALGHMADVVAGTDPPPRALSGDWQGIRRVRGYRCAYWFPAQFEVCLDALPARATIEKGRDGALRYLDNGDSHRALGHCREGLLTHFQGWKKNYYVFAVRPPPRDAAVMVVSDAGFIPLRVPALPPRRDGRRTYNRLTATDASLRAATAGTRGTGRSPRLAPPGRRSLATAYCLGFAPDLKRCTCPLDGQHLRVLRVARSDGPDAAGAVTLVTATWAASYTAGAVDAMLDSWAGPKVVVVGTVDPASTASSTAASGVDAALALRRNDTTVVWVDLRPCQHAARGPFAEQQLSAPVLPDNALYNIGLDVAATDLVCLAPPGLVFQADAAPALRRQLWASGGRWGGLGGPLPVAIVVPTYVPRAALTPAEAREEANDATLVAYPPRGALCGADQSSRLRVPWGRDARAALDGDALAPVSFHAKARHAPAPPLSPNEVPSPSPRPCTRAPRTRTDRRSSWSKRSCCPWPSTRRQAPTAAASCACPKKPTARGASAHCPCACSPGPGIPSAGATPTRWCRRSAGPATGPAAGPAETARCAGACTWRTRRWPSPSARQCRRTTTAPSPCGNRWGGVQCRRAAFASTLSFPSSVDLFDRCPSRHFDRVVPRRACASQPLTLPFFLPAFPPPCADCDRCMVQGLDKVYTPGPFGAVFEAEQASKMEQGGVQAQGLRGLPP